MEILSVLLLAALGAGAAVLLWGKQRAVAGIAAVSMVLVMLAGCQTQPDAGSSQPSQSVSETAAPGETTRAPMETTPATETERLDGIWNNITRYDYDGLSTWVLWNVIFYPDYDTVVIVPIDMMTLEHAAGAYVECGEVPGVEFTAQTGNYSLAGDTLTVTYQYSDQEDYEDYTAVYTVERLQNGSVMKLNGEGLLGGKIIMSDKPLQSMSTEEACLFFGADMIYPEPQETTVPQETVPAENTGIVGKWFTMERDNDAIRLYGWNLVLEEDGQGYFVNTEWISWDMATGQRGDEWSVQNMGCIKTKVNYTFEADTLYLTYLYDEMDGNIDDYPDVTFSYSVEFSENGNAMTLRTSPWNIFSNLTFRRAEPNMTVEDMCRLFGVDYTIPEIELPPENTQPQETVPEEAAWLVGYWQNLSRQDYEETSHLLLWELSFNPFGYGYIEDDEWMIRHYEMESSDEWEPGGRSYVTETIRYAFEGNTLTLTYLENDYGDYEDYDVVYTVTRSEDGKYMTLKGKGGFDGLRFMRAEGDLNLSLEELCRIFDVDYSIP